MHKTPAHFIEACGGYRAVARRFGMQHTTLHTHIRSGSLPAKLYRASCELAAERGVSPPDMSLFSFARLTSNPAAPAEDAA